MKTSFIFTLVIALGIYFLVNAYILIRGWQALEIWSRYRWIYAVAVPLLALSMIAIQLLKRTADNVVIDFFWLLGATWLVCVFYTFLSIVVIDLLRLIMHGFGEKPAILHTYYPQIKFILFCTVVGLVSTLLSVGYYNATRPKVTTVELEIHKSAHKHDSLNVVMASDLHLGCINGRASLQRWVNNINALHPDVVLLPGDVFDDNPASVKRKQLGDILAKIKAPLGVYFASGNHENYGNLAEAVEYLKAHGIHTLLDEAVLVDSSFYVVGRYDRSHGGPFGQKTARKPLAELMATLDSTKPIFVLDHQPVELKEAAEAGTDLQVSGHTHRGQIWPFNRVTRHIYEKDWGYLQKNNTHFYVTQGIGTWGPPIRLGTRSEIVQLKIKIVE